MPKSLSTALAIVAAALAAFVAGVAYAHPAEVVAQDRGPVRPNPSPPKEAPKAAAAPLMFGDSGGVAAAANDIIAVTGSYGVGSSVLYVIDTARNQLAVYEARGGSPNASRLFLVGARRIDLDLQLEGYNDLSEFDYSALKRKFEKRGAAAKPDSPADHPIPIRR